MFFSQLIFAIVLVAIVALFDFSESFLPKDLTDLLYSDSEEDRRSEALDDLENAYDQKEAEASKTKAEEKRTEEKKTEEKKTEERKVEESVVAPKSGASTLVRQEQKESNSEARVNFAKKETASTGTKSSKPMPSSDDLRDLISKVSNNIYKE